MTVNEKINIPDKKAPIVLLAPLDWGLGHATRSIPLIKHLLSIGCKVIIASEGSQQLLLKQEFTELRFVHLKGYRIKYSKKSWQTIIKIFLQFPKILTAIKNEKKWIGHFLLENHVDAIISDNRYGFYDSNIHSVFITHQLMIKSPFGVIIEKFLQKYNYRFIGKFTECWIPDFEGKDNLSGELSHPASLPATKVKYLGKLSRITKEPGSKRSIELLIMLSGPEPQRSIFENILLTQLTTCSISTVLIRGLPAAEKLPLCHNKKLTVYNHLSATDLNRLINDSTIIISRSGYSTIMDLIGLNKKCIFIPTPGQPEQEYLARYLSSKKLCLSFPQKNFSLQKALTAIHESTFNSFNEPVMEKYKDVLEEFVKELELRVES